METFLFTLFGSVFAFYFTIVVLFIILIISDLVDSGTSAAFAFLVFLGLNYFWGSAPIADLFTLANIAIYLSIGFVFSLIRTSFKGRELTNDEKKYYDLKAAVFRWWFLWPISIINWLFGELLRNLYNWIYSKFVKIFEYLFGMPNEVQ